MFFLKNSEIEQLIIINNAIANSIDIQGLLKLCDQVSEQLTHKDFAYTYAACLLATQHKTEAAKKLFSMNIEDTFCKMMHSYISDTNSFDLPDTVFKSADPYSLYVQTEFFQKHLAASQKQIRKFALENPPPNTNEIATIVDIGVGNGVFITKLINEIAPLHNLKSIRLIIIDQSEDMLKSAKQHCLENIQTETEIISIKCKIQDITKEQIETIKNNKPIWFINAALSVHHMPRETKIPMLRQMGQLSQFFVLTEVNWNHDLPKKDSPELIYSVARSYSIFSKSIEELPVSEERKKNCLYHFPVAEAINILKQDRSKRIDYHTTIDEWQNICREANHTVNCTQPAYEFNGQPFSFVMVFKGK